MIAAAAPAPRRFSIVVCTRNRVRHLHSLLLDLVGQTLSSSHYEVIVVDNGSEDDTESVVRDMDPMQFRYIREDRVGLSFARNAGVAAARAHYIGFTDDDCRVSSTWLETAWAVIEREHPDMLGGPYSPLYLTPPPPWFKDSYAAGIQADEAGFLPDAQFLSGGNLFIRRDLVIELGGFNTSFGMTGSRISLGEETELIVRARQRPAGATLYFEPSLNVQHVVSVERMDLIRIGRRRFASGRDACRLLNVDRTPGVMFSAVRLVGQTAWFFMELVRGFFRDKDRYRWYENYLVEVGFRHLHAMGWHSASIFRNR